MDFFELSEGDDYSRNDSSSRRGGEKEKVPMGSSHGSEKSGRDAGKTGSYSPQNIEYFFKERSKEKKAKRKLLKRRYKKWKGKHKRLEKVVQNKDKQLREYHKDINTVLNKWEKWKTKYKKLESASKTVGRRVPLIPFSQGRLKAGKIKRTLF